MNIKNFLLLTACLSHLANAYAQDGENGANRRVTTPANYGGVGGRFSEPSLKNLRMTVVKNPEPAKDCFGKTTSYHTDKVDKPQMYVGFQKPLEADLGVEYGVSSITSVGSSTPITNNPNAKWKMFVRVTALGNCHSGLKAKFPPVGIGSLGEVTMLAAVGGKAMAFTVIKNGMSYTNIFNLDGKINPASIVNTGLVAKRVIAMT